MDRNPRLCFRTSGGKYVALRKESVDRNLLRLLEKLDDELSLSARRAWIEIKIKGTFLMNLRGRSPQGERG